MLVHVPGVLSSSRDVVVVLYNQVFDDEVRLRMSDPAPTAALAQLRDYLMRRDQEIERLLLGGSDLVVRYRMCSRAGGEAGE